MEVEGGVALTAGSVAAEEPHDVIRTHPDQVRWRDVLTWRRLSLEEFPTRGGRSPRVIDDGRAEGDWLGDALLSLALVDLAVRLYVIDHGLETRDERFDLERGQVGYQGAYGGVEHVFAEVGAGGTSRLEA